MHLSIFLLFVFALGHEDVHGPSAPVVAQLGGSVLLPCFSESPLPLEGLQMEWRKMDSDSVVSLSRQGESRPDLQSQEFRGRVDFSPDELLKGNFSILIRNVVKDDVGVYRCQINTTQRIISSEVIIEIQDIEHLVVTGAGHAVFAREGEDVILNCSVESHVHEIEEVTWKKTDRDQDVLVLLYQDSEIFTDSSHESYQGRVHFFYSEMPKGNFSLKLTDVQMEDQGEFVCEVHTGNMSARTVVVLQGVGFSALHISILLLCSIALMLALGFCIPVFMRLKRPGARDEGLMKMHIFFILCPNICMFVAFCLWSKEGFLTEAVSCLSVSIIRPVMLMKTCPDLKRFPDPLQKTARTLAGPLYNSIITISACSFFFVNITRIQTAARYVVVVLTLIAGLSFISGVLLAIYDIWIRVLICLDIFNVRLLGVLVSSTKDNFDYILEIPSVVPPLVMGVMMVITLKKYFFQGKVFDCVHITLSSVIVTIFSLSEICVYVIISIAKKDFSSGWKLLFEAAVFVFVWSGVIYLLKHKNKYRFQWRKIASICCILIAAILIFTYVIYMSYSYKNIFKEQKDAAGYVTLVVFVHILAVTALFKHPVNIPKFLHIMVYMFGAVVLSTVNAIALATELILKADKGARTIGDLRVVVFSLETLFVSAWVTLQMYDTWRKFKDRRNPNSLAEEEHEMRAVRRDEISHGN